jgi:hypothetical protein
LLETVAISVTKLEVFMEVSSQNFNLIDFMVNDDCHEYEKLPECDSLDKWIPLTMDSPT